MAILTSIFQAIFQAITFILPVSESGHSAIFHDFAGRYSGECSELTGLIHIGIAVGIIVAFYKVFIKLIFEFFSGWKDLFTRNLNVRKSTTSRRFMYFTLIPYVFAFLYLIPVDEGTFLYDLMHTVSYDGNLLSEGICFIVTAVLLYVASRKLNKDEKGTPLSLYMVLIIGAALFVTIPIAGLSFCAVVVALAIIMGVNKKVAFRFFIALSAPSLIIMGIIEIVNCATYVTVISGIIAVIISAVTAFFVSKLSLYIFSQNKVKYFSTYNLAVGVIATVVGIFELVL